MVRFFNRNYLPEFRIGVTGTNDQVVNNEE